MMMFGRPTSKLGNPPPMKILNKVKASAEAKQEPEMIQRVLISKVAFCTVMLTVALVFIASRQSQSLLTFLTPIDTSCLLLEEKRIWMSIA